MAFFSFTSWCVKSSSDVQHRPNMRKQGQVMCSAPYMLSLCFFPPSFSSVKVDIPKKLSYILSPVLNKKWTTV